MTIAKKLLTRRSGCQVLAGGILGGIIRSGSAADLASTGHLTWEAEPAPDSGHERRYRANAQILLISLPLVRWSNVGGGSVVWREIGLPENAVLRFLEFTGFSRPEHAGGLNRLGFIREISRGAPGGVTESLYFGLMTASPEETAEEARKALHPKSKEATYTAIDGRLDGAGVQTVVAHFTAPAQWSVANRNELVQMARKALAMTPSRPPEGQSRASEKPFLATLADALRQEAPVETRFAYASRFYRLWLQKTADVKATSYFQERRLISAGRQVVRANGRLRRESGGRETSFRLWIEDQSPQPLPLRIEYQAKSYLRLIFEAEA